MKVPRLSCGSSGGHVTLPFLGKPQSADGEAVKQTGASGANEVLLCTTWRAVGEVPGRTRRGEGVAVGMPYPGAPLAVACPVVACLVLARSKRGAIHL